MTAIVILACELHVGNLRGETRITKLMRMSQEAILTEYRLRKMKNIERTLANLTT